MDPMSGRFVEEDKAEAWMGRISIGEIIKIKGEELEVVEIEGRHIRLKLLSSEDRGLLARGDRYESLDTMREDRQRSISDELFQNSPSRKKDIHNTGR